MESKVSWNSRGDEYEKSRGKRFGGVMKVPTCPWPRSPLHTHLSRGAWLLKQTCAGPWTTGVGTGWKCSGLQTSRGEGGVRRFRLYL